MNELNKSISNYKFVNFSSDLVLPEINLDINQIQRNPKFALFGNNNLLPEELRNYTQNSVTHASMHNTTKLAIAGDGFEGDKFTLDWLSDNCEKTYGTDILNLVADDLSLYGGFALQLIWNRQGTEIAKVYVLPFKDIRVATDTPIKGYYLSNSWKYQYNRGQVFYPEFNLELNREEFPTQIIYATSNKLIGNYYPLPSYISALKYIVLEFELANFHLATISNAALPSTIFHVPASANMNEEMKEEYLNGFKKEFMGSKNSGKFMLNFYDGDVANLAQPTQIPSSINDDLFMSYVELCEAKILSAWNATSPVLIGQSKAGSLSDGGNEIVKSWQLFNMLHASKSHRLIEDVFNDILKINNLSPIKIKPFIPDILDNEETKENQFTKKVLKKLTD